MKKQFGWIIGLAAVMLLAGCSNTQAVTTMKNESAPAAGVYTETASSAERVDLSQQKLIKTANIQAETSDLDALLTKVEERIAALGGYVESSELKNMARTDSETRRVNMTVRIPAERLEEFVEHVEGESNVIASSEKQEDVTLQYTDNESRLKALQTEHNRLLALMEQAQTMEDILTIEARVTEVLYEIESMTAQLRKMDDQVSYATVTLQIEETRILTQTAELGFWGQIGKDFGENLSWIGGTIGAVVSAVIVYSPQLLLAAALVIGCIILYKRSAKRSREKWAAMAQEAAPLEPQENNENYYPPQG